MSRLPDGWSPSDKKVCEVCGHQMGHHGRIYDPASLLGRSTRTCPTYPVAYEFRPKKVAAKLRAAQRGAATRAANRLKKRLQLSA